MSEFAEKEFTGYDGHLTRRIAGFAKPHAPLMLVALISLIVATVGEMLVPVVIQRTIDRHIVSSERVQSERELPETVAFDRSPEERIDAVRKNVWVLFVIMLCVLVATFGQVYVTAYTGQLIMKDLRRKVFDHVTHLSLRFLGSQQVGRLVTRATNDVETINELFTSVLAQLLKDVSVLVAVIVTMFSLNARLAALVVTTMLPVAFVTNLFRVRAREAFRNVRRSVSRVNSYLSEHISGMGIVQLYVQQARTRGEFAKKNKEMLRANLGEMYVFATFRPIIDLLSSVSIAATIVAGAWLLSLSFVSLGVLIAFTDLVRRFFRPVMSISEQFTLLQSALAGSERIFDLLDQDDVIPDEGTERLPRGDVVGRVEFQSVSFSYKEGVPVLTDLAFEVPPGTMSAIVGYTGSGKTTIINVLTRLWDVDKGSVLIDGRDLRQIRRGDLRSAVQQIQQDVFVFNSTIYDNIALGLDVSRRVVNDACEAVQLGDVIRAMPEGLDTVLTESGTNLSLGQRQLLSFARVLVHDPPVLVLDEATSSIDTETEKKLQHAVEMVTGGRTSLVVAHRLSTIEHADQIIVLDRGTVAERGTHTQLLAAGGHYATLYQLQFAPRGGNSPR